MTNMSHFHFRVQNKVQNKKGLQETVIGFHTHSWLFVTIAYFKILRTFFFSLLYLLHSEVEGEPNHCTCHHRFALHPAGLCSLHPCANFSLPEGWRLVSVRISLLCGHHPHNSGLWRLCCRYHWMKSWNISSLVFHVMVPHLMLCNSLISSLHFILRTNWMKHLGLHM